MDNGERQNHPARLAGFVALAIVVTSAVAGSDLWENVSSVEGDLYDVVFVNDRTGWAIGEPGLLKTTDAGTTWSVDPKHSGLSIWFWNDQEGLIAQERDILETADGGHTWNKISALLMGFPGQNRIWFTDRLTGWIVNDGVLLHTNDGGYTWKNVHLEPPRSYQKRTTMWCCYGEHLRDIFFADDRVGWIVGGYAYMLKSKIESGIAWETQDGGTTWERVTSNGGGGFWDGIFGFPDGSSWVVGSGEVILKKDKLGKDERYVLTNYAPEGEFGDYGFLPKHSGLGLLNYALADIWFSDPLTGWALGDRILHTTDGGESWIEERPYPEEEAGISWMTKVARAGDRLVAVGGNGKIMIRTLPGHTNTSPTSWGKVKDENY